MISTISREDQQYLQDLNQYMKRYTSPGATLARKPGTEAPKSKNLVKPMKKDARTKDGFPMGRKWVATDSEKKVDEDQYEHEEDDEEVENRAPSRFLDGQAMEVMLNELPVKFKKELRNPMVASFEVVPKAHRQVITLSDEDFQAVRVPRPVDHKSAEEENSEDEFELGDWEVLGDSLVLGQAKQKKLSYAQAALAEKNF